MLYAIERGVRRVVACSAQAARLGVRAGMPLAEVAAVCKPAGAPAGALRESLTALPHDPAADRGALLELAAACGRFSPLVGVEDSSAPECLLLDISRVAVLFGGEAALVRRVAAEFAARGLNARLCAADTVGAAWAGAHWLSGTRHRQPNNEPNGRRRELHEPCPPEISISLLAPEKTAEVLKALPIEALRLPAETVELLHRLGLRWIGQLEQLPRKELGTRFRGELLRRMDQAFGRLAEPVPGAVLPECYRVEWSGEYALASQAQIGGMLGRLLVRLCAMLRRSGRGVVGLECRLDCLGGARVPIGLGLFQPTASAAHLGELVQLRLESLRLPGPVVGIELEAVCTAPLWSVQPRLFELAGADSPGGDSPGANSPDANASRRQTHTRALAGLVERLSSRLGARAVLRVRWLRHCQPELAWEYEPLVGADNARRRRQMQPAGHSAPLRPLRLLPQPVCLETTAPVRPRCAGRTDRGSLWPDAAQPGAIQPGDEAPPRQFVYAGRRHQVARAWGPERIETGWWRRGTIRRDYYRVETSRGQRYWIFRRLDDGRWFLHGLFE